MGEIVIIKSLLFIFYLFISSRKSGFNNLFRKEDDLNNNINNNNDTRNENFNQRNNFNNNNSNNPFSINDQEKMFFNNMFNMMDNFERDGFRSGFIRDNFFDEFNRGLFGNNQSHPFGNSGFFDISEIFDELNNMNMNNMNRNRNFPSDNFNDFSRNNDYSNRNFSQNNYNDNSFYQNSQREKNIKYSDDKIYDV